MTPEPDPPEPEPKEELSVATANAQGVVYLMTYDGTQPDIQTYSMFDYDEVAYTLKKSSSTVYLAIPRSANEGDQVRLGYYNPTSRYLYFNEKIYTVDSSGNVTGVYNTSTAKPTLTPENADLQAKFQNNSVTVELSEVIR